MVQHGINKLIISGIRTEQCCTVLRDRVAKICSVPQALGRLATTT
jgi:hypothetical protein